MSIFTLTTEIVGDFNANDKNLILSGIASAQKLGETKVLTGGSVMSPQAQQAFDRP